MSAFLQVQAAPTPIPEFPFEFREGFLWIKVTVPQVNGPLNFLVDTGAGVSAINLATAKRLGLKLGREVTVRGVHSEIPGFWQQHLAAKVSDVRLPSTYLAVDLEKLSSSCERPVDGLLGADFFRGRIVQIDFDAQKIRILGTARGETATSIPLQVRSCGIRVEIKVNTQKPQWIRCDTGCATALQWVAASVPDECERKMAIGLTEMSIPQTTTTVRLGEQEFQNVPTGLHKTPIFPGEAGLLGNALLSRFTMVTIDAKGGRLLLQGRRNRNDSVPVRNTGSLAVFAPPTAPFCGRSDFLRDFGGCGVIKSRYENDNSSSIRSRDGICEH